MHQSQGLKLQTGQNTQYVSLRSLQVNGKKSQVPYLGIFKMVRKQASNSIITGKYKGFLKIFKDLFDNKSPSGWMNNTWEH